MVSAAGGAGISRPRRFAMRASPGQSRKAQIFSRVSRRDALDLAVLQQGQVLFGDTDGFRQPGADLCSFARMTSSRMMIMRSPAQLLYFVQFPGFARRSAERAEKDRLRNS